MPASLVIFGAAISACSGYSLVNGQPEWFRHINEGQLAAATAPATPPPGAAAGPAAAPGEAFKALNEAGWRSMDEFVPLQTQIFEMQSKIEERQAKYAELMQNFSSISISAAEERAPLKAQISSLERELSDIERAQSQFDAELAAYLTEADRSMQEAMAEKHKLRANLYTCVDKASEKASKPVQPPAEPPAEEVTAMRASPTEAPDTDGPLPGIETWAPVPPAPTGLSSPVWLTTPRPKVPPSAPAFVRPATAPDSSMRAPAREPTPVQGVRPGALTRAAPAHKRPPALQSGVATSRKGGKVAAPHPAPHAAPAHKRPPALQSGVATSRKGGEVHQRSFGWDDERKEECGDVEAQIEHLQMSVSAALASKTELDQQLHAIGKASFVP